MFEKSGKYYADWRDASGRRLRKAFTTRRAALQFEAEQKELAHPKPKARETHLPRFSAPNTSGQLPKTKPSSGQRAPSSLKLVHSRRKS